MTDNDNKRKTTDAASEQAIQMGSDQPSAAAGLAVIEERAVSEPIIVENTLWASANPQAYGGGQPSQITHLRELEFGDKHNDGRW